MDRVSNSILLSTSRAAGRSNDHFASISRLDQLEGGYPRHQTELQRITARDMEEVSGSWWSPCYSYNSMEDIAITCPSSKNKSWDGILKSKEGDQGAYEERSSHATCLALDYDTGSLCPTKPEGLLPTNHHFCQDATKNQDYTALSTSPKQSDFITMECTGRTCAQGDYLFDYNLVKNKKFCLLVDRQMEAQMRAEFYPYCLCLSDIIRLKYRFLGIPVEVEACQDQPQDKINVKAFNIMLENWEDVAGASRIIDDRQLVFSLREPGPSPSYHVKYEVLKSVGVFNGQCFRQNWMHQLQKGDIVTADWLKGNKIRIIKWCPAGSKIDFDLPGWVLLKTEDIHLLRRIDHRGENKVNNKFRSRSVVISPLLPTQKIIGQHCETGKKQVRHKSNLQRVSASNISPFRVLVDLDVRKGRREPAVIAKLKAGVIVWANQHKGSMLRIIKMDRYGNILVDANMKPKNWGWVCLQRRGDVKPRLVRIPLELMKTGRFKTSQCGHNPSRSKHNFCAHNHTHRAKKCRKDRRTHIAKFAEDMSRFQGKKHFNTLLFNDLKDCVNYSENKDVISSSQSELAMGTLARDERHKDNYAISGRANTYEPITFTREIKNQIIGASGQVEPYLLQQISAKMHSSSSESSMSTSSVSSRPELYTPE